MIEYQVDEQMLEEVQAKLGEMSRKAPMVISRALNKVAVTARVDLANKAQATYTVKSGGFKKDMTIRKASAGRLEAVIHSQEHVYIIYRRSEAELPARREEVHHAKEEGIEFMLLNNPVKINGDEKGNVKSIECIKMELGEPDASGRRRPIPVEGSNFELPVDTVIMSLGTSPNPLIRTTTEGLEANKHGCLIADDNMATTREGVYAGGDAVTGAATVILAMGAGKTAAASIDEYIQNKNK